MKALANSIALRVQAADRAGVQCRGDPLRLAKRHVSRRTQLIRVWTQKYEASGLDEDAQAADMLRECETKIAALECMVGRQALPL